MGSRLFYRKSGEYHFIQTDRASTSYSTFTPNPLSEKLEVEVDAELANLMSNANRLLGQLEGMSAFLPNVEAIESVFMHKEALLSCQIDGRTALPYSVFDASKKDKIETRFIRDYVSVMNYGLNKMNTSQYISKLLCEMHKRLIHQNTDKYSGHFRKEQVFLGKALTNMEQYLPTAPIHIHAAMRDLENFIQSKDNFDAVIKMALAHYQFETIHPFMTGNGRIGRILSYLILSNMKIITRPILCLSQYLQLSKLEYIDRMERLRQICEYEQWVKFFIKSITYAAADSLERIKKWLAVRELNLKKIKDCGKTVKAIEKTFDILELYPIIDVNTLAEKTTISYNTAAATLKLFSEMGIVHQSNSLERNRDYANSDFIQCFLSDIYQYQYE